MTAGLARLEPTEGFDVVRLASPANRNALSLRMMEELLEHIDATASGEGRGLVLDHDGPVFCAGVDLRERQALGATTQSHSSLLGRVLRDLWTYPKPVLCRVDGATRGGGMGLVACSDIVVASSAATFAYSEVRVGVAPALVAAVTLPKVPTGALLPWLLTGDAFDAETAHGLGLVTRVAVSAPSLEPETTAIRASGPIAAKTVKRLVRRFGSIDVERALDEMETLSSELFAGAEAREGMAAFSQRRPPAWAAS